MSLPIYEFILDEKGDHFTTAIVKDAAIEKTLMYFNKEKPTYFANEEKRIIYCVAMTPNKMIFRKETANYPAHNGFFSAESIEKFQLNYAKFKGQEKTNIGHTENLVDGVFMIENWIVKDSEMDKTKSLGIEAENGSLIQAFKIENDEVWDQCKSGDLDGLSIEVHLDRKLISNFKTEIEMSENKNPQGLWNLMKEFFAVDVPPAKTPEEIAKEKADAEAMAVDPATETQADEDKESVDLETLTKENEDLKAKVAELETKLATMEADDVKNTTEMETMAKEFAKFKAETPAAAPIVNAPKEQKEVLTPLDKFKKQHLK